MSLLNAADLDTVAGGGDQRLRHAYRTCRQNRVPPEAVFGLRAARFEVCRPETRSTYSKLFHAWQCCVVMPDDQHCTGQSQHCMRYLTIDIAPGRGVLGGHSGTRVRMGRGARVAPQRCGGRHACYTPKPPLRLESRRSDCCARPARSSFQVGAVRVSYDCAGPALLVWRAWVAKRSGKFASRTFVHLRHPEL